MWTKFSCISHRLGKINALTLLQLIKEIGESYSPKIHVSLINFMFDVEAWMKQYTEPDLTGHVSQHQFKVSKKLRIHVLVLHKRENNPDL